jgi:hypothetical protein
MVQLYPHLNPRQLSLYTDHDGMIDQQTHPASEAKPLEETDHLVWHIHLLRQEPQRLPVILGASLFVASVAWMLFQNLFFSFAAILMILSAASEYLLPCQYRLTSHAARCRYGANRFEIEWKRVRRVLLYKDGVRLSPLSSPSRLDNFRGVFLRFAPEGQQGDRESVLKAVKALRASPERPDAVGTDQPPPRSRPRRRSRDAQEQTPPSVS